MSASEPEEGGDLQPDCPPWAEATAGDVAACAIDNLIPAGAAAGFL